MALKSYVIDSNSAQYTSAELTGLISLITTEGVLDTVTPGSNVDFEVIESSPAAMTVDVGTGFANVIFTKNSETWKVIVNNNASETLTVSSNTSGSQRDDAVIVVLSQAEPTALKTNVASLQIVDGTPGAGVLSDADIDTFLGHQNWARLADIEVANAASSILTANITDTRALVTLDLLPTDGNDTYVTKATNQTSGLIGNKTWGGTHIFTVDSLQTADTSAPSSDTSVPNKKYVDDQITNNISGVTLTFGEAIDGTTTPQSAFISRGTADADAFPTQRQIENTATDRDIYGVLFYGQTFTTDAYATKLTSVDLCLDKILSPSGNFVVDIYAVDGSNHPTGSSLGTVTISASAVPTTAPYNWVTFTFSSAITVTPSTVYAIRATCISGDAANHIAWHYDNTAPYAGGNQVDSSDAGSTWNTDTTDDFMFRVYTYEEQTAGQVYRSDQTGPQRGRFDGFVEDSISASADGTLRISGLQDGFTGLTDGGEYHVDASTGGISLAQEGMQVGVARSTTEIFIERENAYVFVVQQSTTNALSNSSNEPYEEDIYFECGFAPSRIELHFHGSVSQGATSNSRILSFSGEFLDGKFRGNAMKFGTSALAFTATKDGFDVTSMTLIDSGSIVTLTIGTATITESGFKFKVSVVAGVAGSGSITASGVCYR